MSRLSGSRTVGTGYQALVLMALVSLFLVGAVGSRLAYLQLVEGDRNRQLAENNRIRLIPKQPERGKILDRKGRVLANSRFSYSVFVWPIANTKAQWPKTQALLAQILKIPEAEIQKRLEQAGYSSTSLIRIARSITPAQVIALAEHSTELVGVEVEKEAIRNYPYGELGAHVLGYIGELTDEELKEKEDEGYRLGDVMGQMGIEAAYEKQLRGTWGGQQVEVDGAGRVLRVLGEKPSQPGNDVQTTLDLDVQKAAEAAFKNRKGAIVAMDPRNGAVLAMVGQPAFNPNWFASRITEAQWNTLQSREFPFVNRAMQGFPPASTFKIVTASAGLESGKFSPSTILPTYGAINVGGIAFHDWNNAGFGPIGFVQALQWSSDTFFYQIGMGVGEKALIQWTRRYGFGRKTGIDIPGESAGLVPDETWKKQVLGDGWYAGDTVIISIGQGALQTTPLQVAVMFSVPANGGYKVKPHLLKNHEEARNWRESINLKPSTLKVLQNGLRAVVTGGTGTVLNVPTLPPVAGKSGTAEDEGRPNHAWFGGYAPFNRPEITVVAFAENSGGHGGSDTGPLVLQVMQAYFKTARPQPVKPLNSNTD